MPFPKILILRSLGVATVVTGTFLAGRFSVGDPAGRPASPDAASSRSAALTASTGGPLSGVSTAGAPGSAAAPAGSAYSRLSPPTPEQAAERIKAIFENEDPVERMSDFLAFLKTLDSNEARASALGSLMENFNPRERAREVNMLMSQWAAADPDAALASAKEIKDWPGRMAAYTVLTQWTKTNPDAAIAWATENGKEANTTEDGNFYMVGVLYQLSKSSLDRAGELAQTMNRSRARGEVMSKLIDRFLDQRSPEAVQNWAAGLPDSAFKDGVTGRLAGALASKDAPAAAAWAASLPENNNKSQAMAEVVQRWSRDDPNEAGAWLNQFPASPATDSPRESFAWEVQKTDPEAAIAWAATITDDSRRERATRGLVKSWFQREPELARQWVDASALPDTIKSRYGTQPNG